MRPLGGLYSNATGVLIVRGDLDPQTDKHGETGK